MSKINKMNFFDNILTYKEYKKRIKFLRHQSHWELYCIIRNKLMINHSGFHKIDQEKNDGIF